MDRDQLQGHWLSLFTIFIWEFAFIATKVLLRDLEPVEILLYQMGVGFLVLLLLHLRTIKPGRLEEILIGH
jgi:drug/metabolite transporter (DMT)-like permease